MTRVFWVLDFTIPGYGLVLVCWGGLWALAAVACPPGPRRWPALVGVAVLSLRWTADRVEDLDLSPRPPAEAGELLEYSWSGPGEPIRPVRWELTAEGQNTRLTLTLQTPDTEDIARSCAGWEAHLMMVLAAIEGVPIKFPFERFQSTRKIYSSQIT